MGRILFLVRRLRERLWVKPLAFCLLAVLGVLAARAADSVAVLDALPDISAETIEKLLSIIAASMLAVATFAVASMISAYGSASSTATPRVFPLVVSDDVSQTALSSFIGAFIFSIVALIAVMTGFFGHAGRFIVFMLTLSAFAWVVLTFVRWVDSIARLGRLGATIAKAEAATERALVARRDDPCLGGRPLTEGMTFETPVYSDEIGYVQHIDMGLLQREAERRGCRIAVAAQPGRFNAPGRALAYVSETEEGAADDEGPLEMTKAFTIGAARTFEADPRFGLIALSEIASRALSPAVNDPGTAIAVIGAQLRLLSCWVRVDPEATGPEVSHDRVFVAPLSLSSMLDDAFTAISRDGAGTVEVGIRLQKSFLSLSCLGHTALTRSARAHSKAHLARAERAMSHPADLAEISGWASRVQEPRSVGVDAFAELPTG